MFKQQSFETNIYMKLFHWAYLFLAGNLSFMLVSFPFFLVTITSAIDVRNLFFFLGASVFFLPAALALMAWINKWREEKEVAPFKDYFHFYFLFWKKSFLLGSVGWLGCLIVGGDILFLSQVTYGRWLVPFLFLLLILLVAIQLNSYYFQVKNPEASVTVLLKVATYVALKKWYISLLNAVLVGIVPIMMILKPQFGFTLFPVFFFGLIYLNCGRHYRGIV